MRELPKLDSRVVSQALLFEEVQVEGVRGEWVLIVTPDRYRGWVPLTGVVQMEEKPYPLVQVARLAAHLYPVPDTEWGPLWTLPFGVSLQVVRDLDSRWLQLVLPDGREGYIQKGDVETRGAKAKEDLISFSQKFLELPYTWGGRSSFGFDCSGFVQMIYHHQFEIFLPRDSKDQVRDPRFEEISLQRLSPGDLLFFGKSEEQIGHVALSLGADRFIHASSRENKPYLRISCLTDPEWSGQKGNYYLYRVAKRLTL